MTIMKQLIESMIGKYLNESNVVDLRSAKETGDFIISNGGKHYDSSGSAEEYSHKNPKSIGTKFKKMGWKYSVTKNEYGDKVNEYTHPNGHTRISYETGKDYKLDSGDYIIVVRAMKKTRSKKRNPHNDAGYFD